MRKRVLSSAALALAVLLTTAGCVANANSNADSGGAGADQTLTIAYSEGGNTLDPAEANDGTSDTLVVAAYDQLVTYGTKEVDGKQVSDTATIAPMLASEWSADDSGTVYTFTLRDDVTFQSGKKLVADDVVRSFAHIEASASASFLYGMAGIAGVEAKDDHTVEITLTGPNHLFLQILPMYSFSILDMDLVEENGGAEWLATHTAGTGPYVIDSWDPATSAKLTRNEDYWGEAPALGTVNLKFIGDASNRLQLLKKGSVDAALEIAPKDLEGLNGQDGVVVDSRPSNKILFFAMNNAIAPFDNPKVRQAISYAIPYDKLIDDVMKGQASPMRSSVASSTPGFTDEGYAATYDLDKAKALLAEAGYPDGFEFEFTLGSGFSDWNDDAVLIQAELAKIGVTMNITNMARAQFLEALAGKNVQSYISRWTSFVNDPGYHLGLLMTSQGTSNYMNYSNPRVDELWAKAASEQDAAVREQEYGEMQKLINEETPWAYLYEYNIAVAHGEDLQGYTSYPDGLIRFFQLSKSAG
ncbi:ABC transporter substrate-binding protein [Microbacterium resistens]|uniref:ABC transporter substrate-binding protein n=1 Tax=Microbacterium resistens TaxID=156977 RepID=A0ABY3RYW4_9MICO|nr:ABC transporter substrate-binding protein [Microbacterium resistens]MBW1640167.1 ABC transporter substrate-binding protein [Microbacterium resistens]UGS28219.1 ABC transporter substrate-binding protein [Microbacterium resistens]